MSGIAKQHIFVVDDEPRVCESISRTLERFGGKVTCFARAAKCLEQLRSQRCHLLITELKMPDMGGIELVRNVKHLIPWLPIVVVTGYGDIPTAVKAIKVGAVDFIEKPLHRESFVGKVKAILQKNGQNDQFGRPLTHREKTVLRLVAEGKRTKEIATSLHRSEKTIKVHRSRIMRKLGVHNLVGLVKRAAAMGMVDELDLRSCLQDS